MHGKPLEQGRDITAIGVQSIFAQVSFDRELFDKRMKIIFMLRLIEFHK